VQQGFSRDWGRSTNWDEAGGGREDNLRCLSPLKDQRLCLGVEIDRVKKNRLPTKKRRRRGGKRREVRSEEREGQGNQLMASLRENKPGLGLKYQSNGRHQFSF